jgi:hypothetical protein
MTARTRTPSGKKDNVRSADDSTLAPGRHLVRPIFVGFPGTHTPQTRQSRLGPIGSGMLAVATLMLLAPRYD